MFYYVLNATLGFKKYKKKKQKLTHLKKQLTIISQINL